MLYKAGVWKRVESSRWSFSEMEWGCAKYRLGCVRRCDVSSHARVVVVHDVEHPVAFVVLCVVSCGDVCCVFGVFAEGLRGLDSAWLVRAAGRGTGL